MEEDWKSVHLAWINKTKTFLPKYSYDYTVPYLEIMKQVYSNPCATQAYARACYNEDRKWWDNVNKLMYQKENEGTWFVTIGFSHQTWTIPKCLKLINRILNFQWVKYGEAVFELHRENGLHPHVHMIIKTDYKKGKIIESIWGPKDKPHVYIRDLVPNRASVAVMPAVDYHIDNYMNGKKADKKMDCVHLDRKWRLDNNIPDKILSEP